MAIAYSDSTGVLRISDKVHGILFCIIGAWAYESSNLTRVERMQYTAMHGTMLAEIAWHPGRQIRLFSTMPPNAAVK